MEVVLISLFLVTINTVGQIFLKKAALTKGHTTIWYLFLGYLLFIFAIITSFYLMKIIELKYFTVIMSSVYLLVLIASVYLFKEPLNKNKIFGTILLTSGIIIFIGGGR